VLLAQVRRAKERFLASPVQRERDCDRFDAFCMALAEFGRAYLRDEHPSRVLGKLAALAATFFVPDVDDNDDEELRFGS
jgi:hypothetical protein